jgi:acyl carrier protein
MGSKESAMRQLEAAGLHAIDPAGGIRALEAGMKLPCAQIVIADRAAAFLHRAFPSAESGSAGTGPGDVSRAAQAGLEDLLRTTLAGVLSLPPADLDPDTAFSEFGMDSVALIDAVGRLEESLGISLHHSDLIEHPTVNRLASRLRRQGVLPSGAPREAVSGEAIVAIKAAGTKAADTKAPPIPGPPARRPRSGAPSPKRCPWIRPRWTGMSPCRSSAWTRSPSSG